MEDLSKFNWPLVGHKGIKRFLQKNLISDKVSHAYLFTGPKFIGKTTMAKLFANSLICENYKKEIFSEDSSQMKIPCGECSRCKQWKGNIYPDIYWIEREEKNEKTKTQISVEQIRNLIDKISKRSFADSYKIVIIPEAEMLSIGATNALLKTLEEPTVNTVILLISSHKENLLPTIYSRCQHVKFPQVSSKEIYAHLVEAGAPRTVAKEMSRASQGKSTVANKFLNAPEKYNEHKQVVSDLAGLLDKNTSEVLVEIESFKNYTPEQWKKMLNNFLSVLRDVMLIKTYNESLVANIFMQERLSVLAKSMSVVKVGRMMRDVLKVLSLANNNINFKLAFENLMVR